MRARAWLAAALVIAGCGVDRRGPGSGGSGGNGSGGNGSSGGNGNGNGNGNGGPGSGATSGGGVPQNCPGGGTTTISGTVFAPNGTLPLYDAIVYVPSSPVAPFPEGVTCDRCDGKVSGDPLVWAISGADGRFTLKDAPWGGGVPLVVQIGKWRRQVTLPSVTACQPNAVDGALTRLPRNHTEGDLPKMAIATGRLDPMECLLLKVGLDAAEIQPTGAGTRVELFTAAHQPGTTMPGAKPATELYASLENLLRYDLVLFPCEGAEYAQDATDLVARYVNQGGRLFTTHYSYDWLTYAGSPFNAITLTKVNGGWDKNQTDFPLSDSTVSPANLVTSFPKGAAFAQWLVTAGVASAPSTLGLQQLRHDIDDVDPMYAQAWATDSMSDGKPGVAHLTFNTPIDATCNIDTGCSYCGRVVFSDFHVAQSEATPLQPFPTACVPGPLTDQEKALAFMLFDLSSCVQSDGDPPTPIG